MSIRNWFKARELEFNALITKLDIIELKLEAKKPVDSIEVIRHALGSIDLSDVTEDEEMSESERKEYNAAVFAVFPRLEKDIRRFQYLQVVFSANQSADFQQVVFGRGGFNSLDIILEHWRKAEAEHRGSSQPKEDYDIHEPLAVLDA